MIIDLILVALILFSAYRGYKKGLISILISLLALILSIVLGFTLKDSLANYLYENTKVGTTIEQNAQSIITQNIDGRTESLSLFEEILSNQEIQNSYEVSQLPKVVTMFSLKIISFVLILAGVYIICLILQLVLNLFFKLPVINSINKLGGAVINTLQTLLKVWIVLAIIYFMMPIQKTNDLSDLINNSFVTKGLYENNFFVSIIESNIRI